jgi:hypothetical protein
VGSRVTGVCAGGTNHLAGVVVANADATSNESVTM